MTNHPTPGDWRVEPAGNLWRVTATLDRAAVPTTVSLATVYWAAGRGPVNARLMAAAPALRDACIGALDELIRLAQGVPVSGTTWDRVRELTAALEAVRGEGVTA